MTKIDEIIEETFQPSLESISIANGYLNDASVLSGYMVHYANDLFSEKNDLTFPCIAFEPMADTVEQGRTGKQAKIGRVFKVVGAVDARKPELVNSKLNSLVNDVRRAATINMTNEKTKAHRIVIGDCEYSLSKKQSQYAFFEMTITVEYVEDWS